MVWPTHPAQVVTCSASRVFGDMLEGLTLSHQLDQDEEWNSLPEFGQTEPESSQLRGLKRDSVGGFTKGPGVRSMAAVCA